MNNLYARYWNVLVTEIQKLPNGRVFHVRDAFGIDRWIDVKMAGYEKQLGSEFFDAVKANSIPGVSVFEKDEQGVQRYKILK